MTATPNRLSTVPFNEPGDNPRNVPAYVSSRLLGAGAAETISIPGNPAGQVVAYVRIAATADIFYLFTSATVAGPATVPGDIDDGSACELIKAQGNEEFLMIPSGATGLSVISSGTPIVTASFYTN